MVYVKTLFKDIMQFTHVSQPFSILKEIFLRPFDGAYLVANDKVKFPYSINHSWDGELAWLPKDMAKVFLDYIPVWFQDNLSKMKIMDGNISNCLIYSHTPRGTVFIDTQIDMGSILDNLYSSFDEKYPEFQGKYYVISDCHLADNLFFGRGSVYDAESTLTLLYEEGVIDNTCFFRNLEEALDEIECDRTIVLTGKFPYPREEITEQLECLEYLTSNTVSKNCWLWTGEKPGASKVKKAQQLGIEISNTLDLMKWYLQKTEQTYIEI